MSTPVAGPYSAWRRAGDWIILSGQIGILPGHDTPTLTPGGVTAELRQALSNAKSLLEEAGASFDDVVKALVLLADINDFSACNEIWVDTFAPPRPTRSAFGVAALPFGARIEVELWAFKPVA